MQIRILPKTTVCLTIKVDGIEYPIITVAKTIQSNVFSVIEPASINGLATIVTHGTSKKLGHYWYTYNDFSNCAKCLDIIKIEILNTNSKHEFSVAEILKTEEKTANVYPVELIETFDVEFDTAKQVSYDDIDMEKSDYIFG